MKYILIGTFLGAFVMVLAAAFGLDVPKILVALFSVPPMFCIYFLPTLMARKGNSVGSIFVVNLFLGWTLICWVLCLAWAISNPRTA